ncbi:Unknown protein [Striga hermonthica]|uniref:Uncharacterized protein n=1 Tax=Striga hermonthica TaxID=68872 RepID=A0A9N7P2T0_STRHE|nr:Unknown protein [Striga hermonthica]
MCYEVKCGNCSKKSWEGCGRHVAAVHKGIPDGQHCHCKPWPGVDSAADSSKPSSQSHYYVESHDLLGDLNNESY